MVYPAIYKFCCAEITIDMVPRGSPYVYSVVWRTGCDIPLVCHYSSSCCGSNEKTFFPDRFYTTGFLSSGSNLLGLLRHVERMILHDDEFVRISYGTRPVSISGAIHIPGSVQLVYEARIC